VASHSEGVAHFDDETVVAVKVKGLGGSSPSKGVIPS